MVAALGLGLVLSPAAAAGRFRNASANQWSSADTASPLDEEATGGRFRGRRPLTTYEAAAIVGRLERRLEKPPPPAPPRDDINSEIARIKAAAGRTQADISGVRDDLEFHLKKEREEKERKGKTTLFGVGEVSYTLTDSEANLSPTLRFPYDWDQTPLSGVTGASGGGKGFFAVDYYKVGFSSTYGPRYTFVALLTGHPGAQANNPFANGMEMGALTLQGEAIFAEVKDIYRDQADVKIGYFWLPWGREVQGLLRLNPHFNSNSLFYKDGFSQANGQTGLFFQSHNKSRIQYGAGLTSGDKEFNLPGTVAFAHSGQFAHQRPLAADNSRLGRYASVQGKFHRFDWDLDYWDNGGEPGFFDWESFNGGFTWGPHRRFTMKAEIGKADIVQSTGATAEWVAWYSTIIWRLASDTDAAFRYDYATIGSGLSTARVTTERTVSVSHRFAEKQLVIADYCHPESNPGFNPASPVLNPGRDIQDDLLRVSYRLVF